MEDLSLKPQPGFGFRPRDSELVSYYLRLKNYYGSKLQFERIPEIDVRKMEPWEFPGLYVDLSVIEKDDEECFFFSSLDRKYRSGNSIKRATKSGYWKPTGKNRDIMSRDSGDLIGSKKSLVFYLRSDDRKSEKDKRTNWKLHEYRAPENEQGAFAVYRLFIPSGKKAFNSNWYDIEPSSSSPSTTKSSDGTPSTPASVQATPESNLQGSKMWLIDNFNMMVDSLPPTESHHNINMASMEDHESEPISSSPTTIESSPGGTPTPALVPVTLETLESDMQGFKKTLVDNSDNTTSDTLPPVENHRNYSMASGMKGHESDGSSEEDPQGDEHLFASLTKELLLEMGQEFDFDPNQSPVFQNGTSDEYSNKLSGSDKVTLAEQVGVKASDRLGPSMCLEALPVSCLSNSSSNTLAEHWFVTPTSPSTAYTLPAVESKSLSYFNKYDGNLSFMPNSWQSTHI